MQLSKCTQVRWFKTLIIIPFFLVGQALWANEIIKSPNDDRLYQYIALDNGLRAIVVEDPQAIESACSLEINVGSYDEPEDYLGLAHFLEHMLFLGTEKYPDAKEYHAMIQHNGGMHNAFTAGDRTHYFFNVQSHAFEDILMRFAEFFKSPLFNKDLVDRERHNVDSEFQMYINQDNWRLLDVSKATANPNHPFHRFNVGNMQTLNQEKDIIHQAVVQFYQTHYSAERMTLVLVSPHKLQTQVEWIKQYFSGVPKRPTPPPTTLPIFTKKELNQDITVKANGNARKLQLMFAMPSFARFEKEQPLHLISQLLGYEGSGSLYDILNKKGWITSLVSSADEDPDSQDILQIEFSLTPAGFKHIDDITQDTFAFIELIKKQGFPKVFFEDIQKIHQLDFTYLQREPETKLAQYLAHRLHERAPQNMFTSRYIMPDVTYQAAMKPFQEMLTYLTPEHARRVLLSPETSGNQTTKWFKAEYSIKPLVNALPKTTPKKLGLQLPESNPYIPTDLSLQGIDERREAEQPNLVLDQPTMRLWHHNDKRFEEPRLGVFVNLINPMSQQTPKHQMMCDLLAQLTMEKLKPTLYPAIMLGEKISLHDHPRGMTLKLYGFNNNKEQLLQTIVQHFKRYEVDEADFERIKERQLRAFKNFDQLPPFKQAYKGLHALFVAPNWHIEELQNVLMDISATDIMRFKKAFLDNVIIEILTNGNITEADAKALTKQLGPLMRTAAKPLPVPPPKVFRLPSQTTAFKTLNTTDQNHAMVLYLQNEAADVTEMAKAFIVSRLLSTPMYQRLRVEQQIGYALGVSISLQQMVAGLVFYIQSPNMAPENIYAALQRFWQDYHQQLQNLASDQLNVIQQALVKELRDPPKTLQEQSTRFWPTIELGRFDFALRDALANAIEATKLADIQSYYQTMLLDHHAGRVAVVSKMANVPTSWQSIDSWQALKSKGTVFEF